MLPLCPDVFMSAEFIEHVKSVVCVCVEGKGGGLILTLGQH